MDFVVKVIPLLRRVLADLSIMLAWISNFKLRNHSQSGSGPV
jgi:hypothetical protein